MDQTLQTARARCRCVAIGTQVFILGGDIDGHEGSTIASVEILDTETGQLIHGPDMPQVYGMFCGCCREQQAIGADRHHTLYDKDNQIQCGKQLP